MKTKLTSLLALMLVAVLLLASCGGEEVPSLWDSATYTSDTAVGSGATSVTVSIEAEDKVVTLTVNTDKQTLGEALFELDLINDASFFDTANGMKADWDKDSAYWAFYIGEEYQMIGVGDATLTSGAAYRLVYTVSNY